MRSKNSNIDTWWQRSRQNNREDGGEIDEQKQGELKP